MSLKIYPRNCGNCHVSKSNIQDKTPEKMFLGVWNMLKYPLWSQINLSTMPIIDKINFAKLVFHGTYWCAVDSSCEGNPAAKNKGKEPIVNHELLSSLFSYQVDNTYGVHHIL